MGNSVYANLKSFEGNLEGNKTLEFPWKPREVQIINDGPGDLLYKFNESEDFATLRPDETVQPNVTIKVLILFSSGADYRVWGIG